MERINFKDKFGHFQSTQKSSYMSLLFQFIISHLILIALKPPFVCNGHGELKVNIIVTLSIASTVVCMVANRKQLTVFDIFRGVFDLTKRPN